MTRTTFSRLTVVTLPAFLVACGASLTDPNTPDPDATINEAQVATVGDTVSLEVGESVRFEGTGIGAGFERLVSDSRCAIGATCVWEGDAEVALRVWAGGQAREVRLHTRLEPRAVDIGSYRLELVDVLPFPNVDPEVDLPPTSVLVRLVPR